MTDLLQRRVTVEPDGDERMLRIRQRPCPERPDFLAIRLKENTLDKSRVVHRRHAEGWKRLRVSLGAGADRLLERLLRGLVLLGLRLSGGDGLLAS